MCRDECRLPLNSCSTLGAVHVLVPVFEAGRYQEQSLVGDKSVNADVMRCLQSALTFQRSDFGHKTFEAWRGWEGDLSHPVIHGARLALANP